MVEQKFSMNQEFVHNYEEGVYQVLDEATGAVIKVNKFGERPVRFINNVTGIDWKARKLSYTDKTPLPNHYTPISDKFYGYFQFPCSRLNGKKMDEIRAQSRQSRYSRRQVSDLKNCYYRPELYQTVKKDSSDSEVIDESCFVHVGAHLTGTIKDALATIRTGRYESLEHRRKTAQKKALIPNDDSPFICKALNRRKVHSPNKHVLKMYLEETRMTKTKSKQSKQSSSPKSLADSVAPSTKYQSLDISLRQHTKEYSDLRTSQHQSPKCTGRKESMQTSLPESSLSTRYTETLITCKDHLRTQQRMEQELNAYPQPRQEVVRFRPRVGRAKISTELELYHKFKEFSVEF